MSRKNWSLNLDIYFSDIMCETKIILQMLPHTLVLKHSALPRDFSFQGENTGSKFEENVGIGQTIELSIAI